MLSEKKIRLMSRAALYESSIQYRRDSFIRRYFKPDYIALNGFITKVWLTIFFAGGLIAHVFRLVYVDNVDLLHFEYEQFMIKAVIIYLILNILLSVLSSAYYGNKYGKAERRMEAYYKYLDQIDLVTERADLNEKAERTARRRERRAKTEASKKKRGS